MRTTLRPLDGNRPMAKLFGKTLAELPPTPSPTYASWEDFLGKTKPGGRTAWLTQKARAANERYLPAIKASNIWAIVQAQRGLCVYCGSLAVEKAPVGMPKSGKQSGGIMGWAQVGRRIGTLEHIDPKLGNLPTNLAWACMLCNTFYPNVRAALHECGGLYLEPLVVNDRIAETRRRKQALAEKTYVYSAEEKRQKGKHEREQGDRDTKRRNTSWVSRIRDGLEDDKLEEIISGNSVIPFTEEIRAAARIYKRLLDEKRAERLRNRPPRGCKALYYVVVERGVMTATHFGPYRLHREAVHVAASAKFDLVRWAEYADHLPDDFDVPEGMLDSEAYRKYWAIEATVPDGAAIIGPYPTRGEAVHAKRVFRVEIERRKHPMPTRRDLYESANDGDCDLYGVWPWDGTETSEEALYMMMLAHRD